jgi:hypothetical protein
MSAVVRWLRGGEARVVSLDAAGRTIVLQSTVPWPPGSRVEGTLEGDRTGGSPGAGALLRVKVHSSRKESTGQFVLEGRPLDLARETRERLEALLRDD